jgi:hypothetical protein
MFGNNLGRERVGEGGGGGDNMHPLHGSLPQHPCINVFPPWLINHHRGSDMILLAPLMKQSSGIMELRRRKTFQMIIIREREGGGGGGTGVWQTTGWDMC